MHNACLNLCRVKTRDQLMLDRIGYLTQYPQYFHEYIAALNQLGEDFLAVGCGGVESY